MKKSTSTILVLIGLIWIFTARYALRLTAIRWHVNYRIFKPYLYFLSIPAILLISIGIVKFIFSYFEKDIDKTKIINSEKIIHYKSDTWVWIILVIIISLVTLIITSIYFRANIIQSGLIKYPFWYK